MRQVKTTSGQTIQDIALQEYGTIEAAILILVDNDMGINDNLYPGQLLNIRDEVPTLTETNKAVVRRITKENIHPNRGTTPAPKPEVNYVEDNYIDDDYIN